MVLRITFYMTWYQIIYSVLPVLSASDLFRTLLKVMHTSSASGLEFGSCDQQERTSVQTDFGTVFVVGILGLFPSTATATVI